MSERRRSALWGALFGYSGVVISLFRNVLLVPVYLRYIPLAEYGAWLATGGALALLIINDFGLTGVVTQKASARVGAGDFRSFGLLSGSALSISVILAAGLTLVSLACAPFLPTLGALSAGERHTVLNCFYIAVTANAIGVVATTACGIIRSLQLAALAGSITLTGEIANVAVMVIALSMGKGLYAIALAVLVRSAIIVTAALMTVGVVFSRTLKVGIRFHAPSTRELLADSVRFFVTSIAMKMQSQANVFFVGMILGPASAAMYSLTVRAHETVMMLIGQINGALVPGMTHLLGSGNQPRFRAVLQRILLAITAATAFAMAETVTLNASFLRLWVGREVFAGQTLSVTMGIALFVSSIGYVGYDALVAQGRFKLVSATFAATSALHLLLLLALLHYGLWATSLATLVSAAVWSLIFWRSIISVDQLTPSELRGLTGQLVLIVAISIGIGLMFFRFYPPPKSWIALVFEAALFMITMGIWYLACSAALRKLAREEIGLTMRLFRFAGCGRIRL